MTPAANPDQTPASSAPACAYPWTPDQGDGTFRNPIIYADYSDLDVIRHGGDFFMTASSFNCNPGLPVLMNSLWVSPLNQTMATRQLTLLSINKRLYYNQKCAICFPN
jgi:hypothetical protein